MIVLQTMEGCLALRWFEQLVHGKTWRKPKCSLLTGWSQSENVYILSSTIWHFGKDKISENIKELDICQELERRKMSISTTEEVQEHKANVYNMYWIDRGHYKIVQVHMTSRVSPSGNYASHIMKTCCCSITNGPNTPIWWR